MTDEQVMTLSVAIILPLCALIYSNSRISDTRVALEGKMNEMKETFRAEMKAMRIDVDLQIRTVKKDLESQIQIGFAQISAELREMRSEMKNALHVHELEHHK